MNNTNVLISFIVFFGTYNALSNTKIKELVQEPTIKTQCYKQTTKGTDTILHRIKCPMEVE